MASKRWSVAVTDLTGTARLHEITVEADNWMSALRSGRTRIGEEGGVPQGASCAVSPDGVVTILDSVSRRKFVLTQRALANEATPQANSTPPTSVTAPSQAPSTAASADAMPSDPSTGKRKKFQTVAFDASMALPVQPQAEPAREKQKFQTVAFDASAVMKNQSQVPAVVVAPVERSVPPAPLLPASPTPSAAPAAANAGTTGPTANAATAVPVETDPSGKRKKFQTVAFDASTLGLQQPRTSPATVPTAGIAATSTPLAIVGSAAAAVVPLASAATAVVAIASAPSAAPPPRTAAPVSMPAAAPTPQLQLLHQRSEDPTPKNPLTYRERSFVISGNIAPASAEQFLRTELARLKEELVHAKRGKFINLALFDHSWQARPQRPPIATLQWKDWKGDPEVVFPAAAQAAQTAPATSTAHDDRLATAFEALQDLPFLNNAAEGLDFAVKLLGDTIPSQAVAACLYDINTDELRVVAAAGTGSQERKAQAIPVAAGVFGQAARAGDRALVIADAQRHPDFDPGLDSAPGIQARNMLLRPLMQEGQLFGVLQLINRVGANGYSAEDVSLINYIAERVADFVRKVRLRGR